MIKCLLLTIVLTLNACTSTPDLRPHAFIHSENKMRQGISSYQQDNYLQAIKSFKQALTLYQSIDNQKGILLARINLIESALAISQFKLAQQNLALLGNTEHLPSDLSNKIILLKAHNSYLQEQFQDALQTLQPLLPQIQDIQTTLSAKQIDLLLTVTKFTTFAHSAEAIHWFNQVDAIMRNNSNIDFNQKALFKRLSAHIALQKNHQELAIPLMQQSIDIYKSMANRRAIATCLEELSQFYYMRENIPATHESLNRALFIRQWLKDTYKTAVLIKQLNKLEAEATLPD